MSQDTSPATSQITEVLPAPPANTKGTRHGPPEHTKWRSGQSGNPNGRPKGFAALVRQRTRDGKLLVDFAVDILKGTPVDIVHRFPVKNEQGVVTGFNEVRYQGTPPLKLRLEALHWLGDRGWGKPAQPIEVDQRGAFLVLHKHWSPGQDPLAEGHPTIVPALPAGQPT